MSVRVRYNLVIKQQTTRKTVQGALCTPHVVSAVTEIWPHLFHLLLFFSLVKYLKEMPIIKSFQPHILTYGKNGCFLT